MARQSAAEQQRRRDVRQVRQHYVHWGVKTVIGLLAAAVAGSIWLAWRVFTGR